MNDDTTDDTSGGDDTSVRPLGARTEPSRPPDPSHRRLWLAAGAVLVTAVVIGAVLLVATRDDTDDRVAGTSSTTTESSSSSTSSSTTTTAEPGTTEPDAGVPGTEKPGIDPMPDAGTTPVSVPRPAIEPAALTDVRIARQEGYDRVVFEFADSPSVPGYAVGYVEEPVIADPSGEPVPVSGDHALEVRMDPASGVVLGPDTVTETYTGPTRIPGPGSEITEVVRTGDFEAVMTWVIGTRDRVDFRVFTLSAPTRVVVDLRNH
jgi:hypothetical protein